jgi:hypothetical protein
MGAAVIPPKHFFIGSAEGEALVGNKLDQEAKKRL